MNLRKALTAFLIAVIWMTSLSGSIAQAEMPYAITVDLTNQIVTIYSTADDSIVRQMLCSTARKGYTTPEGVFEMAPIRRDTEREKWYYLYYYNDYVQYASRITGNILFHSMPYTAKDESTLQLDEAKQFGYPASHGCIRLLNEDSKFIAENCLPGTLVKIYRSEEPQEELRSLLFTGGYTSESGLTYDQFLGIPDDPDTLGRFSSGQEVLDLQYRLRALGYLNDEISETYNTATVNAVKQFQADIGCEQNGQVTPALYSFIFSPDAPTSISVTLTSGVSGPLVRKLQESLTSLRLYEGELDGIYDVDVIQSIRLFQQAYGYAASDEATPEMQQAIRHEAEQLAALFGASSYTCEQSFEAVPMATVVTSSKVRIRSEASTDSEPLDKVGDGEQVLVHETDGTWSKVQYENTVGYMMNSYLEASSSEMLTLHYTGANGQSYTIGNTIEQYRSGASLPAEAFAKRLASVAGSRESVSTEYATVSTGAETLKLNLRTDDSPDGEIIAELLNGSEAKVLHKGDAWTLVESEAGVGYLMNDYLSFHTVVKEEEPVSETEEMIDELLEEQPDSVIYATVQAPGGTADVFDVDSDDANQIGYLPHETQVVLVSIDDGWCYIDFMGNRGYMREETLSFDLNDGLI